MTIRGVPDGSGSRKGSCRSFGIGKFAVASLTFARAAMMFLRRARSTATAASVARKSRNDLEDGCTKNSRACGRVQESLGRSSLTNCTSVDAFSAVMRIMRVSNSALLLTRMMRITAEKASTEVQLVSDERPSDSWTLPQALEFLVQPSSKSLRDFLATEAAVAVDLALRKNIIAARAKVKEATANLPIPNDLQLPFLLPEPSGTPRMVMLNPDVLLDTIAPKLSSVEEEYAYALEQLYTEVYGADLAELFNGKSLDEPQEFVQRVISSFTSNVSNGGETANMLTPAFWSGLRDRLQEGELGELQAALRTLTDSDRQVLQGWTKEVLEMGWDTTLARIQYLGK
mmetsp:Transcript_17748/g.30782  ORF Transcript_17748/g.30782 Transcript_17748/m.30782 type:complete len:343 (+) Transcript_17748:481-1509(+)